MSGCLFHDCLSALNFAHTKLAASESLILALASAELPITNLADPYSDYTIEYSQHARFESVEHEPFGSQTPLGTRSFHGTEFEHLSDQDLHANPALFKFGETQSTVHGLPVGDMGRSPHSPDLPFPYQESSPPHASRWDFASPPTLALPLHHHHHLPTSGHHEQQMMSPSSPPGAPSVVGKPGMPQPAPRPKGPKLKFTPEEDSLLVDLKEKKNLTWKQIADFFPGRTSGTLQVRYCTKLKAKDTVWTDEMVERLQRATQEYENDRWRIIAAKVGNGCTPSACREKAAELSELAELLADEGNL